MQGVIIALVAVILLLLIYWYSRSLREGYGELFYLDQMVMKHPDPIWFKYAGRERDVSGMSSRDYYLENQNNYLNRIAPGYFENDALYVDHTDYIGMPPQYRPRPPAQDCGSCKPIRKLLDTVPVSAAAPQTLMQDSKGVKAEIDAMKTASKEGFY